MDWKKRFSQEQIIRFLQYAEAGVAIKELRRQHGFSDASFHNWRARSYAADESAHIFPPVVERQLVRI